jgi:hypothetical protein
MQRNDPTDVENCAYNDNITAPQIGQCNTVSAMRNSPGLEAVQEESKGHQPIVAIARKLFHTPADDTTNIIEHLDVLKQYWEQINLVANEDLQISDTLFKVIISLSLPPSWDVFMEPYIGGIQTAPKKKLQSPQQLIGILKEEYLRRQASYIWLADSATTSHIANRRDAFTEYKSSLRGHFVTGVGDTKTVVEGRGTIVLNSEFDGQKRLMTLQNVLHIPTNRNNLISLGRWDGAGGTWKSENGLLRLIWKGGKTIAVGNRIQNNLYEMQVTVRR